MFSLISTNITQMQERDPFARLSRRATPSVNIIGTAAIALLASANTFANAAENSSRVVQEYHACAVALGLDPSGRRYRTCISSLARSLSEMGSSATDGERTKRMCPEGAPARYAGFRNLRRRRRTILRKCRQFWGAIVPVR